MAHTRKRLPELHRDKSLHQNTVAKVIRLPEAELKKRLAQFDPKVAEGLRLHNRGKRRHWAKRLFKLEERVALGLKPRKTEMQQMMDRAYENIQRRSK